MNTEFKKLFEIDRLVVFKRLSEMQEYFSITRNFSLKVSSHLKILIHLVNNLIISPDNLELIDTPLLMPKISNKSSNFKSETKESTIIKSKPENESKVLIEVLSSFKNQNDRLFKIIENGGTNADYLKTVFEKMVDNMSQKEETKGHITNNHCHCHQCKTVPNININPPNCDHRNCNCYTKSVYIPPPKEEKTNYNHSVKSIHYKMEKMEDQIKRLSSKNRFEDEKIINELLQDKNENEEKIRNQDFQIKELLLIIKRNDKQRRLLKERFCELEKNNKSLEEILREYLKNKKNEDFYKSYNISEFMVGNQKDDDHRNSLIENLNRSNQQLKNKLNSIKKTQSIPRDFNLRIKELKNELTNEEMKNDDLKKENNNLLNIIKVSEKKDIKERSFKFDNIDFLKCVFVQADFIEEKKKDNINIIKSF